MTAVVHALLVRRADPAAPAVVVLAGLSSAAFGGAVGAYVGGWQIAYGAAKMPLFFLGTLAVSFAALHVFAARDLRAGETFRAALETVAVTAVGLGALAPVVFLLALSCPKPDPRGYAGVILLLTGCVAAAGTAGVVRLHLRLGSWRLTAGWVVIYQFVGAQAAWLLKPWVSHTLTDDRFLPLRENLRGNFYESVFRTAVGLFS